MSKHASILSEEDCLHAAQEDFGAFVELTFGVLHPGQTIDHAPYLELMFAIAESMWARTHTRVVINLPPGYMKSLLFSVMFPAWALGRDPRLRFVCISYGDDLAHKHSVATRTLMRSSAYRRIFPGTKLVKQAEDHLTTTASGYRYATAVGSDVTGFRADIIICDDPLEPSEAMSATKKESLETWLASSVLTRLIREDSIFMLIMHRLAVDDISAKLSQQEGYLTVSLPLIATEDEVWNDDDGRILFERQRGELLNPKRLSLTGARRLEHEVGPTTFAGQYQQDPVLDGSGMLSTSRLLLFDQAPPFEHILHSWDIGGTLNGNATVCTVWGLAKDPVRGDVLYLLQVITLKLELPDVRAAIKAQDKLDRPSLIILDHRGIGLAIYQDLRKDGYSHVYENTDSKSTESKLQRFTYSLPALYDGRLQFPRGASFMPRVLHQLSAFPNLIEFDLVDSITQLASYMGNVLHLARAHLRPDKL